MPPGPLPSPTKRRRNAPTIPTTSLPAGGRTGPVPRPPKWIRLSECGTAWWRWAWHTPQAAGWSTGAGFESLIARRASLEDDLAAIDQVESLDGEALLTAEDARAFRVLVERLVGMVTGRLAIYREMRELDDRLGLSPKGMAALRWEIVNVAAPAEEAGDEVTKKRQDRRARLNAS